MRRRTFIKSSAVAAGAALLEGCAREEIAFLEQSVNRRPALKGVAVWRPSSCGQCPAGCGTLVRTIDGDAKKVEGIPQHPINHGGLCALGQASLQGLYNPDRITEPLRRTGAGDFEPIGWEEALGQAAEALAAAVANDPAGLAVLGGDGNPIMEALLQRFAAALGAPPAAFLRPAAFEVERRAAEIVLGSTELPAYDLALADYVFSIGPAFLDRWHSPVSSSWAIAQMKAGRPGRRGKLVQAESRLSLTAASADEWLPVRPGYEGLLARTVAGVLMRGELVPAAVEAYRVLFPDPPPTPEEAAEQCGVPAEKIARIGAELASVENAVVLGGGSAAAQTNGLFNTVATLALNLLLGAPGRTGGVLESQSFALASRIHNGEEATAASLLARLQEGLRVGTLLICEADPVHTLPRSQGWSDALEAVDSVICLSSFMDDTARRANLILPLSVDVERFNAAEPRGSVRAALNLSRPTIQPYGDTRHPADILLALATALDRGEDFPWRSFSELVEEKVEAMASELPGSEGVPFAGYFSDILGAGGVWSEAPLVTTMSGPTLPFEGETEPGFTAGDFHLILFESTKYGDGRGANRPWLQELPDTLSTVMWGSWAEIAVEDARDLGIDTGDLLSIESPFGAVEAPAVIAPGVRPGTVALPLGLGHEDFGRYARGRGVNPLDLIGPARVAGTGAAATGNVRVRIERRGQTRLAMFGRGLRDAEEIPVGWAPHVVDRGDES